MTDQEAVIQALTDQCTDMLGQLINMRIAFTKYKAENPPQPKQPE